MEEEAVRFPALEFEKRYIQPALDRRRRIGSIRKLTPYHDDDVRNSRIVDFSSNDYLGLAQSQRQHDMVSAAYEKLPRKLLGSTGSRLLTGDSHYAHSLEDRLAKLHNRQAALLFNSGYDANLAVLSCLTMDSIVVIDELGHNSLQMGLKLSRNCSVYTFRHNDASDLKRILSEQTTSPQAKQKNLLVVVESVYSMDGDVAPISEILNIATTYNACVICDEAHGLGVFGNQGTGLIAELGLESHPALLAHVFTFGKAAGCHGAVVCGSSSLKEFLLNYGRPIVYSTSLPLHSLVTIDCAYESMAGPIGKQLRQQVHEWAHVFQQSMQRILEQIQPPSKIWLVPSHTPIQALVVPGNTACIQFCSILWELSNHRIRLYPIRSPTVQSGEERVRIILHSHNTRNELDELLSLIERTLARMGFLSPSIVEGSAVGESVQARSRL